MERLVAVLLALVPLAVFPFLDLPYEPPKIALLAFIAALGCFHTGWRLLRGHPIKVRPSAIDWAVLAFLFVLACSTLISVDPTASFFGSSERQTSLVYYACATVLYVYVRLFFQPAHWRLLLLGTAGSSVLVAAYACLQGAGVDFSALYNAFPLYGISGPQRAFSTFGHPNFLGAYLAAVAPFLLPIVLQKNSPFRWLAWASGLLSVGAIFVTYSRAAWLALPAGMAAYCFFRFRQSRKWIVSAGAICFLVFLGLTAWYPRLLPPSEQNRHAVAYRVLSAFDASHGSVLARRNEWKFAWELIQRRPILGHGLDTYMPFAATRVKDARESAPDYKGFDPSVADRIHNVEFDLLWSAGLAGLVAFCVLLLLAFHCAWHQRGQVWPAAAAGSIVVYVVSMQFGFDFSLSFPWLLLAVAAIHGGNPFGDSSATETAGVV